MTRPDQPHALYRFFAHDGTLLYIGITNDIGVRFNDHSRTKPWWTEVARTMVAHYRSRQEVLAAEKAAIRAERPRYNVQHNEALADVPTPVPPAGQPTILRAGDWCAVAMWGGDCCHGQVAAVDQYGIRLNEWYRERGVAVILWSQVAEIKMAPPISDDQATREYDPDDNWATEVTAVGTPGNFYNIEPLSEFAISWHEAMTPRFVCRGCNGEFLATAYRDGGWCVRCVPPPSDEDAPF